MRFIVTLGNERVELERLTIEQMAGVCDRAAMRRTRAVADVARRMGIGQRESLEAASEIAVAADMLTSLLRESATLAGALDILTVASGNNMDLARGLMDASRPAEWAGAALKAIGMDEEGKAEAER